MRPRCAPLILLLLGPLCACAGPGEPQAPETSDQEWKTLHPEQWDIDPARVVVPPMPGKEG